MRQRETGDRIMRMASAGPVIDEGWELLMAGRVDEAIKKFQEQYERHPSRGIRNNIGLAYLCSGDFEAAANLFSEQVQSAPHFSAGEYRSLGIALWLLGDHAGAIATWREGLQGDYADGAGGVELPVTLFFAAVREPQLIARAEPTRLLKKRLRDPRVQYWPGPVAVYLLGQSTEEQLREAASYHIPEIQRRQEHCAEFFIGVRAEADGDHERYAVQMQKCNQASDCLLNDELYLARYEAGREHRRVEHSGQ